MTAFVEEVEGMYYKNPWCVCERGKEGRREKERGVGREGMEREKSYRQALFNIICMIITMSCSYQSPVYQPGHLNSAL